MVAHPAIGARPRLVSAPVATPSQTAAHDLRVEICPRGYDWWHGTGAQLQAEGLIPADFDWPKGKEHGSWVSGRFEFWLFRVRPEGHKGPKSSWLESDSWACRRVLATQARDGFMAADLVPHIWDMARTAKVDERLDPALVKYSLAAWKALPADVLRMPGMMGAAVKPPAGADAQTKMLNFLGRVV